MLPHIVVNACISEGPAQASFNLGQCLNAVVSLLTSCNTQAHQKTTEIKKKCKLLFIKFYYFLDFLKAS